MWNSVHILKHFYYHCCFFFPVIFRQRFLPSPARCPYRCPCWPIASAASAAAAAPHSNAVASSEASA